MPQSDETVTGSSQSLTRREAFLLPLKIAVAGGLLAALTESGEEGPDINPGKPLEPHVSMEALEVIEATDLVKQGSWHQAGLRVHNGSLQLSPTGLSIVNKSEDYRIHPNPPLNVYGSRLRASGDFSVSAHIRGETPVAFQLYGAVPLRFDDFRVERGRLECTNIGNELLVRIWNGSSQEPSIVRRFQFTGSSVDRQLVIERKGDDLNFAVNVQLLGSLPGGKLFSTGEVWFGLNSEAGIATVHSVVVAPLSGHTLSALDTKTLRVTRSLPDGGMERNARSHKLTLGSAVALNPLVADSRYAQLYLGGEIGAVTVENALKPQDVHPLEGIFTFAEAEAIVQLATQNGLVVHGHTLVYDKATPQWMHDLPYRTNSEKQRIRAVLEQHVATVVGYFRGQIESWDVINEAIVGFNGDARLEENIWLKALGEEYIDIAFHAAHAADPDAKLYINDYGMETNPNGRGQYMIDLVRRLKSRNVPIHGVGIQGHVYEIPRDTINPNTLRRLMDRFNDLQLKVRISELDVTGAYGPKKQAEQYLAVLRVCLQASNCSGLTFWGLDDEHGSTASIINGVLRPGNALLYTTDFREKYARRVLQNALRE